MRARIVRIGIGCLGLIAAGVGPIGVVGSSRQARAEDLISPPVSSSLNATEPGPARLTFCRFGPKAKAVGTQTTPGVGCEARLRIQSTHWECAPIGGDGTYERQMQRLRDRTFAAGAAECARQCRKRGPECRSQWLPPARCGLEFDARRAAEMGAREGCRSECAGTALVYCSVLDAGMQPERPTRMDALAPNCRCL